MADERDFIERSQSYARLRYGSEATPEEMAVEFMRYDLDRRAASLDEIDGELKSAEPLTLNDANKMLDIRERRRLLGAVHEEMRKVGR